MGRRSLFPPAIHQHKRGYSYCRVYRQGKPHDVRLGPPGSDEARAAYARLCAELSGASAPAPAPAPGAPPPDNPSVADVVVAWDLHARRHYGPDSDELALYRTVGRVLSRTLGTLPAAALTPGRLEELQGVMATGSWRTDAERAKLEARGRPPGWCRNVVNRQAVRVRTVWRWAERRGLVPPGSWAALRTVPGLSKASRAARQTPPRRPCTAGELDAVCAECPAAVAAMLRLQLLSGMRPGEVRLMTGGAVERGGEVWTYRPPRDKCGWREGQPERAVQLGPECQRVLAPFLEAAPPGAYLFRPGGRSPLGHYTRTSYGRAVADACRRAGVKLIPYQTRHAFRLRVTRACGLDAARAALGHRSLSTTLGYAAGVDEETARDVARRLA